MNEILFADGFDEAIDGYCHVSGRVVIEQEVAPNYQ